MLQTRQLIRFKSLLALLTFVLLSGSELSICMAQNDYLSSQYMNNQLSINPAYAGVRNALSINILSRQQWLGIKDAPTAYAMSVHSPLNKRMASVGGSFLNYNTGPIQRNELTMIYSYLLRVNQRMFLSLGLSAQLNHYNVGLSALDVIQDGDPSFSSDIENSFKPNLGVGAFLYTPEFYLGVSMPQAMKHELREDENGGVALMYSRIIYLTSGYAISVSEDLFFKPSVLVRMRQDASTAIDASMQFQYKNMFWVGGSYRINNSMAALLSVQVSKHMAICYSYDFPVNKTTSLGLGSHEISLSIDSDRYLRRNRDRRFGKKRKVTKKKVDDEDESKGLRSIRHF